MSDTLFTNISAGTGTISYGTAGASNSALTEAQLSTILSNLVFASKGSGYSIYDSKDSNNIVYFKSLIAGSGVTITTDGDTLTINSDSTDSNDGNRDINVKSLSTYNGVYFYKSDAANPDATITLTTAATSTGAKNGVVTVSAGEFVVPSVTNYNDSSNQAATTSFVQNVLKNSNYAALSGASFTGTVTAPTPSATDNSTNVATTAFVKSALGKYVLTSDIDNIIGSNYAQLSGASFTGNVTGVTPSTSDNSTSFATTAYVQSNLQNVLTTDTMNTALKNYLPLTGGTLSGALTLDGAAGTQRSIFMTSSGADRWALMTNSDAEAGNNAGSTFSLYAYPDSGSNPTTVLKAYRNTGVVNFTVSPTAPTPSTTDNSTNVATTAFVNGYVGSYYTSNIAPSLQKYMPLAGGTFTGDVNAETPSTSDNSTLLATTAFVQSNLANYLLKADAPNGDDYALLTGATFTGTVAGVTPSTTDNSTTFATTSYVQTNLKNYIPAANYPSASNIMLTTGGTFTGSVTAPTPVSGDNSTNVATTAFVTNAISTTTPNLTGYAKLSGAVFTGAVSGVTPSSSSNDTTFATTAYVQNAISGYTPDLASYAKLSGAAFTGTVTAPTPVTGDNTTNVATTAFVSSTVENYLPLSGGTLTGYIAKSSSTSNTATGTTLATALPITTQIVDITGGTSSFVPKSITLDPLSTPTGYAVNDTITITNVGVVTVTAVDSDGGITTYTSVLSTTAKNTDMAGTSIAQASTTGSGTGATFDVTSTGTYSGVVLPTASPGTEIIVINRSGTKINVYPHSNTDQIENLGAGVAQYITSNSNMKFIRITSSLWRIIN